MKNLLREARKAARQKDFSRAGDLCDMAGHPLDAIAFYLEGKHYLLAGELAARIGEYAQAAGYFSSGGDATRAAEMYIRAGQKKKASMMYERAGAYIKAAEIEEKMANFMAAAAYYEMGGQLEKAAYLFARAGDNAKGGSLYERLIRGGDRSDPMDSGSFKFDEVQSRKARYTRFAGILYMKAGQFTKAGPYLEEAGLFDQAIQAYRKAGRTDQAAALLIKLEDYAEALKLVDEDPGADIEPKLLGELYLRSGRFEKAAEVFLSQGLRFKAAECFESGGDLMRAAEIFTQEGELVHAADLYSGIGLHEEAASTYEKAGEFTNAGRSYEKAGLHPEAARVFETAGRILETARIHIQQGDKSQAIRVLQRIKKDDASYSRACFMLGGLFFEKGLYAPAAEKYECALDGLTGDADKVKCLYHLGVTYEQLGRTDEACRLYEKILSVDFHHADVADRLRALARQVGQRPSNSTSAQRLAVRESLGMAVPPPSSAPGNISGRLEITRRLGQGRHSEVFEAYDRALSRKVAAKKYPPAESADPDIYTRFLREAQQASELSHPNLLTVFAVGEDAGGRYIIEELVEGRTLRAMLDERIRIEPARAIEFATQICDLLHHAHRRGLIHRDLRPENVFILENDIVKVSDFGLKARLSDPASRTGKSQCYLSPEELRSERVDQRSDLYTFGILLYEMLLGEPPFPADTAAFDHLNLTPPFPVKIDRMLPGFLKKIVEKCLEKDRTKRFRSAAQVLDELKASSIVPGAVIADRYEIVRELGIGGMGRIYQALDRDLDEPVALKMLRAGDGEGRQMERFLREIKMARKITHPNVVKVYDLGTWKDHKYITMEYIDGVNLEQWIRIQSRPAVPEALRLLAAIARGVQAAHDLGIIHRDIKPQNILLQDGKIPKILDFGIARDTTGTEMTTTGFVMGSPKYMSPEQVQALPLDPRTDVYSLGIMMYFVFTGREPFVGDTPSVIAYKHIGETPRPPGDINPDLPAWLGGCIMKALAKDKEERFASMSELAETLEEGLSGKQESAEGVITS